MHSFQILGEVEIGTILAGVLVLLISTTAQVIIALNNKRISEQNTEKLNANAVKMTEQSTKIDVTEKKVDVLHDKTTTIQSMVNGQRDALESKVTALESRLEAALLKIAVLETQLGDALKKDRST